jgi:hypothetical protein
LPRGLKPSASSCRAICSSARITKEVSPCAAYFEVVSNAIRHGTAALADVLDVLQAASE